MRIMLSALGLCLCIGTSAQSISNRLELHQASHHIEKIYISHNKPFYFPADTLWGKVFLVEGRTHMAFDASPIVYLEWIDPEGAIEQLLTLKVHKGTASFDFPIQKEAIKGTYTLRAFTQYQKNFDPAYLFQKEIVVKDLESTTETEKREYATDFTISFYPEGGYLVNDISTQLAFRITNDLGEGLALQGILQDETGAPISQVKSTMKGYGKFTIKPQAGIKYSVKAEFLGKEKEFELPQILNAGFVLHIESTHPKYLSAQIHASEGKSLQNCLLVGHVRGQTFFASEIEYISAKKLLLPKDQIPSGILHFTLFDAEERPVAERLVFNRNPQEQVEVDIQVPDDYVGPRKAIDMNIVPKRGEQIVPGLFSLSVFNHDFVPRHQESIDIQSYLWLQSDIPERLPDLYPFIHKNDPQASAFLDLALMTHGWRRFTWLEVLEQEFPSTPYPPEEHLTISGTVSDAKRGGTIKADVNFSILDENNFALLNTTTEEDGIFSFHGFNFEDTTDILIQANFHNPKKRQKLEEGQVKRVGNPNVSLELMNLVNMPYYPNMALPNPVALPGDWEEVSKDIDIMQDIDSAYNAMLNIQLEEVTIEAEKFATNRERNQFLQEKYRDVGLFYFASTNKVLMDELPDRGENFRDVYDLVGMLVARAVVTGTGPGQVIRFRGSQGALSEPAVLYVDGIELPRGMSVDLRPEDIYMIDVIRGIKADRAYGAGNVISVLTREPGSYTPKQTFRPTKGSINFSHPGYYQAREFYAPNYDIPAPQHAKPDFRTCIYWNSELESGEEGVDIRFFTGDQASKFMILVEGISEDGTPFVGKKMIEIIK